MPPIESHLRRGHAMKRPGQLQPPPMSSYYEYQPDQLVEQFRLFKASLEKKVETASIGSGSSNRNSNSSKNNLQTKPVGPSFVVAAVQFTAAGFPSSSIAQFWEIVEQSIQVAAEEKGAQLVLVPELFLGPYFCQSQEACFMEMAWDNVLGGCPLVQRMQVLARTYGVVLPVSLFERENNMLYNTVVMVDGDGTLLGKYRKSHIPDANGYQEKYYFSPGDTGFQVWDTMVGKVGVGICWDQWFPEAARAMALQGADVLLYPTAIGTEPNDPTVDSSDHWQRVMQGHAAANMVPVVASNRQGTEVLLDRSGCEQQRIDFYGRSFITDMTGKLVAHATVPQSPEVPFTILTGSIHPEANRATRLPWGLFRDRRPELYKTLLTLDGNATH